MAINLSYSSVKYTMPSCQVSIITGCGDYVKLNLLYLIMGFAYMADKFYTRVRI